MKPTAQKWLEKQATTRERHITCDVKSLCASATTDNIVDPSGFKLAARIGYQRELAAGTLVYYYEDLIK